MKAAFYGCAAAICFIVANVVSLVVANSLKEKREPVVTPKQEKPVEKPKPQPQPGPRGPGHLGENPVYQETYVAPRAPHPGPTGPGNL